MEFIELSSKKLHELNKSFYDIIKKRYDFDCVIFVAKGSFLIGKDLSDIQYVPLIEIFAKRQGGKLKKIISPILKILPFKLKKILREREFKSNIYEKNSNRNIDFDKNIWSKYLDKKHILIVDDSVDTGYTIKFVKETVERFFEKSEVKVAALNVFTKSEKIVKTDYFIYRDTMLKGPWSNDSNENSLFLKQYEKWHNEQE